MERSKLGDRDGWIVGLTGAHMSCDMLWAGESCLAYWTFVVSSHDIDLIVRWLLDGEYDEENDFEGKMLCMYIRHQTLFLHHYKLLTPYFTATPYHTRLSISIYTHLPYQMYHSITRLI